MDRVLLDHENGLRGQVSSRNSRKRDIGKPIPEEEPNSQNNNYAGINGNLLSPTAEEEKEQLAIQDTKISIAIQKRKIYKNIMVVNIGIFLMFSAFTGLSIIQSSINGAVGTMGLAVNFGGSIFACLVVAPVVVSVLGCKPAILICMVGFMIWMSSNYHPTWATVIPASLINGIANGPIWTAQSTYFTVQGLIYAKLSGETEEAVVSRFFGLFFCFLLIGISVGATVTSTVLSSQTMPSEISSILNSTTVVPPILNSTAVATVDSEVAALQCGVAFCPPTDLPDFVAPATNITNNVTESSIPIVDPVRMYILVSIHLGFTLVGFIIVLLFMDPLQKDSTGQTAWQVTVRSLSATARQLKRKRMMLLTPLNLYAGLTQTFALADLTQAYFACTLGPMMIGYAAIVYGVVACLVSVTLGFLTTCCGRPAIFSIIHVIRLGTLIFLLIWEPQAHQMSLIFLLSALWAFGDGGYMSQINAMFGVLFYDNTEGAFSAYRFYEALGMVIGYAYNSMLCIEHKLYVMFGLFTVGVILYYVTEWRQTKYKKEEEAKEAKGERRKSTLIVDTYVTAV